MLSLPAQNAIFHLFRIIITGFTALSSAWHILNNIEYLLKSNIWAFWFTLKLFMCFYDKIDMKNRLRPYLYKNNHGH